MSHGRSKRNKERRKALFKILPELKVVHRFIRFKGVPRFTFGKDKTGSPIMTTVKGSRAELEFKNARKVYVSPWRMESTFTKEMKKAVHSRKRATDLKKVDADMEKAALEKTPQDDRTP